jgi:hypothetical protein
VSKKKYYFYKMGCEKLTYNHLKVLRTHGTLSSHEAKVVQMWLRPDPLIQDPDNSQNYNRYAYAWNNPLMYTDPSGNELITLSMVVTAAIIGAIIGAATYTYLALYNGNFEWGGLAKSIVVGAVSGAATSCVGQLVQSIKFGAEVAKAVQFVARESIRAAAHGVVQGAIAGIQGGDFGQAFVTASLTSFAGSLFGADFNGSAEGSGFAGEFRTGIAGQSLFGAASGGLINHFQGGNFWEGAAMGLTIGLLNHSMNKLAPKIQKLIEGSGDKTNTTNSNEQSGIKDCPDCPKQAREGQQFQSKDGKLYSYQKHGGWWEIPKNLTGQIEPTRPLKMDIVKCNCDMWSKALPINKFFRFLASGGTFTSNQVLGMTPFNVLDTFNNSINCMKVNNWYNWYNGNK